MEITSMQDLCYRANIEVYNIKVYGENKYIILYDDHRSILNVLLEAKKLGMFSTTPNIIFFDKHDDACNPNIKANELFKQWGVEKIDDVSSRDFWSFVEFDLSPLDDNWLLAGMELGIINNAVVIGQKENTNIDDLKNKFDSSDGKKHELYSIPHIDDSLSEQSCLGDAFIVKPYFQNVRNILGYNKQSCYESSKEVTNQFVLDFDLDCFTTECEGKVYAWPESIFRNKYFLDDEVSSFMSRLIKRSTFITICREPKCCGGLGESNKILGYLDRYFFKGRLNTLPIY